MRELRRALLGVEIIGNGSGSHHELRKLNQRLELIVSATRKCGGVYLYANQRGCDGGRLYFDGGALIVCNGKILAQAKQFSLEDVQVITATIDLDDVRSYRASIPSFGVQAVASLHPRQRAFVSCPDYHLLASDMLLVPTSPLASLRLHSPEEECCLGKFIHMYAPHLSPVLVPHQSLFTSFVITLIPGPACWLWDYLRRSGAQGFFLPLSGGADSSSVAAIVGAMCQLVTQVAQDNPAGQVADDCRRICRQEATWVPSTSQEMGNYVLHTTYMGTENSSEKTTSRAKRLGETIGSYHLSIKIDLMVQAVVKVFSMTTGRTPQFSVHGGTNAEDLALQNIQARLRMVTAYLYAQLLPWVRGRSGFLLVLGSANVDEGLRGYMTKYDCSSADLNPIGAISKGDLKKMLLWAASTYKWDVLAEIAAAPPTAELRPITETNDAGMEHSQLDEDEMGMTYEELGMFGTLRKISRCGPVSM
jgi:NAD+ synthase (glutamine-hydrolysing)